MKPDNPPPQHAEQKSRCTRGHAAEVSAILSALQALMVRIDGAGLTLAGARLASAIDAVDAERSAVEALLAAGQVEHACQDCAQG